MRKLANVLYVLKPTDILWYYIVQNQRWVLVPWGNFLHNNTSLDFRINHFTSICCRVIKKKLACLSSRNCSFLALILYSLRIMEEEQDFSSQMSRVFEITTTLHERDRKLKKPKEEPQCAPAFNHIGNANNLL